MGARHRRRHLRAHRADEPPLNALTLGGYSFLGGAEVSATDAEIDFLADARNRIEKIGEAVAAIGPRTYFDWGSSWGQQFDPIFQMWRDLYDEGGRRLAVGGDARSAFTSMMIDLNKRIEAAQTQGESALESLRLWFSSNPIDSWNVARKVAGVARDEVSAAAAIAGDAADKAAGALWDQVKKFLEENKWYLAAAGALILGGGYLVGRRS